MSAIRGFLRFRTYEEIKAICKEQGVPFDDVRYLLDGWETVIVGRVAQGYGYVIYNVVTGKFFGVTPEEQYFTSWGHKHTLKEWYNTLLEFFYTDDPV